MAVTRHTALLLAATALFAGATTATVFIDLNVDTAVQGDAHITVADGFPQKITIDWDNVGSVGCTAQARVTVTNARNGRLVADAWSRRSALWPGESVSWTVMTALSNGSYRYNATVHHCAEQVPVASGPLPIAGRTITPSGTGEVADGETYRFNTIGYTTGDGENTLYLQSDADTLHLIPVDYPYGWRIPATTVHLQDGAAKATLPYYPSIYKPAPITYTAITARGGTVGNTTIHTGKHRGITGIAVKPYVEARLLLSRFF